MRIQKPVIILLCGLSVGWMGCMDDSEDAGSAFREDGAVKIHIPLEGSLQNPAWSPDGRQIVFTRFRSGYNAGPADLYRWDLSAETLHLLVADGSDNVNLPGSCWNSSGKAIVFSSSREPHDEIFSISETGVPGDESRITNRQDAASYEPSFSPDGRWIVFESHKLDVEGNGIIVRQKLDDAESFQPLTPAEEDCRQPNWSPTGDRIVYQKLDGQWDIWIMNTDGSNMRRITSGSGDKTDASFSPDGEWIVYSSDDDLEWAGLFIVSAEGGASFPLTRSTEFYDGACSWSAGRRIVFESSPGDPESSGTALWLIDAPEDSILYNM